MTGMLRILLEVIENYFTANDGFHLNGRVWLKGLMVCV